MKEITRNEVADLLTALAEKRDWDHKTWKRCHELIQANLDHEVLQSFYHDFLDYPGLFNLRMAFGTSTKVVVMRVEPNPSRLEEVRQRFTGVARGLRTTK